MFIFKVTIEERVCETFEIAADSPEAAVRLAKEGYKKAELIVENGEVQKVKFIVGEDA